MAQALETPKKMTQERGRGLSPGVEGELDKMLHINWYLPGQTRGATLEIMAQMD